MFSYRKHISLLLTGAFIIGMLWQTVTIVHFYLNREQITVEHCVNIDKPQLNCKGQCHLNKQLKQTATKTIDQEEQQVNAKTGFVLLLVYGAIQPKDDYSEKVNTLKYPDVQDYGVNAYLSEIFEPPRTC